MFGDVSHWQSSIISCGNATCAMAKDVVQYAVAERAATQSPFWCGAKTAPSPPVCL